MKVVLHTKTKEMVDGKIVEKKGEFQADLDFSLASQIRFETKFPELAEKEDLFNYSKRICEIKENSTAILLSKMKMLYCWFDTEINFIDFLKMFDFSNEDYMKELTQEIHNVFELVFNGSAEKN